MLPFGCLIILGNFCFAEVESVSISKSGLGAEAKLHVNYAEAAVLLRSDNIQMLDTTATPQYCTEHACISYYKYCSASGDELVCEYAILSAGARENDYLRIRAENLLHLNSVERSISFLVWGRDEPEKIRLTELNEVSDQPEAPLCHARHGEAECK